MSKEKATTDSVSVPRLIKPRAVTELTSLSRSTIDRMIKSGEFPAPVQLGERRIAWRQDEVLNWIASRQKADWAA